jgi:hypothetical protein
MIPRQLKTYDPKIRFHVLPLHWIHVTVKHRNGKIQSKRRNKKMKQAKFRFENNHRIEVEERVEYKYLERPRPHWMPPLEDVINAYRRGDRVHVCWPEFIDGDANKLAFVLTDSLDYGLSDNVCISYTGVIFLTDAIYKNQFTKYICVKLHRKKNGQRYFLIPPEIIEEFDLLSSYGWGRYNWVYVLEHPHEKFKCYFAKLGEDAPCHR